MSVTDAVAQIRDGGSGQVNPRLLDLFFGSINRLDAIRTAHLDPP